MDIDEWMDKALASISVMKPNTEFSLRDLFLGVEWNTLKVGDRLFFGGYFKRQVQKGLIPRVKYMGKRANNSAWYMIQ